ncbi:hypothetical protein GCM10010207_48530 [Streptomyces atratus]|nr:hypothetical protein GCM10010207_48530 [Streptomyces atratus]
MRLTWAFTVLSLIRSRPPGPLPGPQPRDRRQGQRDAPAPAQWAPAPGKPSPIAGIQGASAGGVPFRVGRRLPGSRTPGTRRYGPSRPPENPVSASPAMREGLSGLTLGADVMETVTLLSDVPAALRSAAGAALPLPPGTGNGDFC